MMASEGVTAYDAIRIKVESGFFDKYLQWSQGGVFYDLKNQIDPVINLDSLDIKDSIVNGAQEVSTFLVSQTTNLIKSLSEILLSFVMLLFSMFFLFKDGDKIVARIGYLSPLPAKYEAQLFREIERYGECNYYWRLFYCYDSRSSLWNWIGYCGSGESGFLGSGCNFLSFCSN